MAPPNVSPPGRSVFRIGLPEAALMAVAMIWGGTFIVVQNALTVSGPFFFVGLRFAAAALVVGLLSWRTLGGTTRVEVKGGCMIGIAIMASYSLQTIGLQTILSSESGFVTALYVPIVPLLQWVLLRQMPGRNAWIGIALAFAGLMLITVPQDGGIQLSFGVIVTLFCALGFALEIILIAVFAGRVDARRICVIQLAAASVLAFAMMIPAGEAIPQFSWLLALSVAGMAIASAAIQLAMNWAQRTVSPAKAAVIYAGEPVWAGVFGRLAGEILPGRALVGAAMIVAAVVTSQWPEKGDKLEDAAPGEP